MQGLVGSIQGSALPGGHHPARSRGGEDRCIPTQSHLYLLSLGFDLSMGESFQKDRWLEPQELNK